MVLVDSLRLEQPGCGGEELLTVIGPGRYFGELGPLFGLPRSATARARTEASVIGYSVREFRARFQPGPVAEILAQAAD